MINTFWLSNKQQMTDRQAFLIVIFVIVRQQPVV